MYESTLIGTSIPQPSGESLATLKVALEVGLPIVAYTRNHEGLLDEIGRLACAVHPDGETVVVFNEDEELLVRSWLEREARRVEEREAQDRNEFIRLAREHPEWVEDWRQQ